MDTVKSSLSGAAATAKRTLTSAPPTDAYLPWNAPGVETIQKDEEEKAIKIADTMNKMQRQHRHCFRATHVKTQAVVKGHLTITSDLPPHLQQGLFAHPRTYPVVARYANEPVFLQPDTAPGPRGIGLKIFDTPTTETRLDGNDNATLRTQDFLFNNAPMLELTDIDTTLDIMTLRERHFDSSNAALLAATAARTDTIKQTAPVMLLNTHIIAMDMFTQSAFRFGDYYGHMGFFPTAPAVKSTDIATRTVPSHAAPNILSDWLVDYFSAHDAVYDFRIQLATDPVHHPTEDASVVWDERSAPWQTIGSVVFPKQEGVMAPKRRVMWEERVRLSPFAGLEKHRPLGGVNRLRRRVYERSWRERREVNAEGRGDVVAVDEMP